MSVDCPNIPGVRPLPAEDGQILCCEVDQPLAPGDANRFYGWVAASLKGYGWVTLTESRNRLIVRKGL